MSREAASSLPILDFGPYLDPRTGEAERAAHLETLAAELREACVKIGFYFLKGSEVLVPRSLVQEMYEVTRRFHAQDMARKVAVKMSPPVDLAVMGYMANAGEGRHKEAGQEGDGMKLVTNTTAFNEAFFMSRGHGHNLGVSNFFPDETIPELREVVGRYDVAVEALVTRILPVYAKALEVPVGELLDKFKDPMYKYRLTHYPETPPQEMAWGIFAHADITFFTLVAENDVPGLSLKLPPPSEDWMPVPAMPPGCFLVNTGEMLHRLSNGRFLNTVHRVENRSGRERYAVVCFFIQDRDVPLDPILAPGETKPRWPRFTGLDVFLEKTRSLQGIVQSNPSSSFSPASEGTSSLSSSPSKL